MSINTAHADNGVLIHAGENIILFSDNVSIDWSGQDGAAFKGTKTGKIYLTTHRLIFNNRQASDALRSFSMPFVCLTDVEVEQPVFGANNIRGKVRAQSNGNFTGEAKFKMVFKSGGAIEFAQCALKAAFICKKYGGAAAAPPPYMQPTGAWHQAPPPAYEANPMGYYGWVPQTQAFPQGPPPDTVFMSDQPPPYPGIVQPGAVPTANGYAGGPPSYPGSNNAGGLPGYAQPSAAYGGYPAPNGGYPAPNGGYPAPNGYGYPAAGQQQPGAYGGYPAAGQQQPGAYGGYPAAGYPPAAAGAAPMYPPMPYGGAAAAGAFGGGAAVAGGSGYPGGPAGGGGPMGFAGPASKENEAAQSAFNPQPHQPQQPNAPPPEYSEPPPSYNSLSNKKQL